MIRKAMKKPVAKPAPRKPTPSMPTPVKPGLVSKKDPFFKSKEYKSFQKEQRGRPATMDMYNSPYFGSVSSGSVGRAQDAAYRKFKNISDPTPPKLGTQPPAGGGATSVNRIGSPGFPGGARPEIPTPVNPSPGGTVLPSKPGGVGTTGFKSGSGGFASSLFGHGTPAGGGATSVNNTGIGSPGSLGARADFGFGMKKGGKVKAAKASAPKASSASKRGDGIATKGKTKGRFV